MEVGIERINDYILKVTHDIHYWMVRTMGGEYYHEFVEEGFIAIGYNEISLKELNAINPEDRVAVNGLRIHVAEVYQDAPRPGHIVSQLLRFCKQIHTGDIIVLPGFSSYEVSLCRVSGEVYEEINAENTAGECTFAKRIPIDIVRTTTRLALPPKAQLMFGSRHPISNIDDYATYIDNSMMDFYEKGNEVHLVLHVEAEDDISVSTFYGLQNLFEVAKAFCDENHIAYKEDDVAIKVQMESPGLLHFISENLYVLCLIGLAIQFINGGGLNIKYKDIFSLNLSSEGLISKFSDFLDRKADRDLKRSIQHSLEKMKIETPADFKKAIEPLLEKINEKQNPHQQG